MECAVGDVDCCVDCCGIFSMDEKDVIVLLGAVDAGVSAKNEDEFQIVE